eukprot:GHVU01115751.1.p4 GENE.GHVU01115751.1~~GHVU01115751.1.p4  ORF type:complete len:118 (+),score=6.15 GHVU01115751.1:614-967(+)
MPHRRGGSLMKPGGGGSRCTVNAYTHTRIELPGRGSAIWAAATRTDRQCQGTPPHAHRTETETERNTYTDIIKERTDTQRYVQTESQMEAHSRSSPLSKLVCLSLSLASVSLSRVCL